MECTNELYCQDEKIDNRKRKVKNTAAGNPETNIEMQAKGYPFINIPEEDQHKNVFAEINDTFNLLRDW